MTPSLKPEAPEERATALIEWFIDHSSGSFIRDEVLDELHRFLVTDFQRIRIQAIEECERCYNGVDCDEFLRDIRALKIDQPSA